MELTDEFKHVMYEETMGIPDRVVKLFMASQIQAILDEKKKLTPALIRRVSKKHMALTRDMINALKQNDVTLLAKYGDMTAPKIENMFEHENYAAKEKENIKILKQELKEKKFKEKRELISIIIIYFSQLGYEYNYLRKITENIVEEHGIKKDIEFFLKKVAEAIFNKNSKEDCNITTKTKKI